LLIFSNSDPNGPQRPLRMKWKFLQPVWQLINNNNPDVLPVRLNRGHLNGMSENIESTISFNEAMTTVINDIMG